MCLWNDTAPGFSIACSINCWGWHVVFCFPLISVVCEISLDIAKPECIADMPAIL